MSVALGSTAHEIIRWLASHGPCTPTALAAGIDRAPLTVYRALKVLKRRGLVAKRELPPEGIQGRVPSEWYLAPANEPMRSASAKSEDVA